MAYDPLTTAETAAGKAIIQALMRKVKGNFDELYSLSGSTSSLQIPNGNFEIATGGTGTGADPDSWTWGGYPGGTRAVDETNMAEGSQCISATHPGGAGNGAGYHESSYVECSEHQAEIITFRHYASAAGMKDQVVIRFFGEDKVDLSSDETVYSSTANPTAWAKFIRAFLPPAGARFMKLRLVSGYTDTDVAGTAYWDMVERGSHCPMVEAGTHKIHTDDGESKITNLTTYSQAKGYCLCCAGELRIKHQMYESSTGYSRVYRIRNGVATAVGAENETSGSVISEDISGWLPGDVVAVYCKSGGGAMDTSVKYFSVGIDQK